MKTKILSGILLLIFSAVSVKGQTADFVSPHERDTIPMSATSPEAGATDSVFCYQDPSPFFRRFIHKFSAEYRPAYILPTSSFLRGENANRERIENSFSTHLRYAFQARPGTCTDLIYGGVYQGIGFAYFSFYEPEQLGTPLAFYLFQGARIAELDRVVSLNYEWNFGLSGGWKPYDFATNVDNKVIGSKLNAYLNINLYFKWRLSSHFDLNTGVELSHFSNGNTKFPNGGLNTVGAKIGLVYNLNSGDGINPWAYSPTTVPEFTRHVSYDLALFGSWRRKGVDVGNEQVASPEAYTVLGFNFAPMYNIGYKSRVGLSLDGVYDGSANVYTDDYSSSSYQQFHRPPIDWQLALGMSARFEYVMPYFSVNMGLGVNFLHRGEDFKSYYQILALKTEITRNSYIHIGYCLQNFHDPNYLMLGLGFRFNNKSPFLKR